MYRYIYIYMIRSNLPNVRDTMTQDIAVRETGVARHQGGHIERPPGSACRH